MRSVTPSGRQTLLGMTGIVLRHRFRRNIRKWNYWIVLEFHLSVHGFKNSFLEEAASRLPHHSRHPAESARASPFLHVFACTCHLFICVLIAVLTAAGCRLLVVLMCIPLIRALEHFFKCLLVVFREISVQVFCSLFTWSFCYFVVELDVLFICLGY